MNTALGPQGLALPTGFSFISFFLKNFVPITLITVISVLGVMIAFKNNKISDLETKVAALQTQVDEKTTQLNTCQSNFDDLSSDVKKISEDTSKILEDFGDFTAEVDKDFASQERKIRDLRKIVPPASCQESIELLRKRIEEVKWKTPESQ